MLGAWGVVRWLGVWGGSEGHPGGRGNSSLVSWVLSRWGSSRIPSFRGVLRVLFRGGKRVNLTPSDSGGGRSRPLPLAPGR